MVDIAASDGFSQSSTLGFYRKGYSGLAVEMDSEKFTVLSFLYRNFSNVRLMKIRVTPENIASVLNAAEVEKNFSILNLDIDSYDLHVMKAILSVGYRPKIISMEINEKIPLGIHFTVNYDINHYWKGDHFYGCSIKAAYDTIIPYGYILCKVEYNNAFFVDSSHIAFDTIHLSAEDAFVKGYINKEDRKSLFPWNTDVDYWHDLATKDAIVEIEKKFCEYSGQFTLFASEK